MSIRKGSPLFVFLLVLACSPAPDPPSNGNYLDSSLRTRVEQLKKDAAAEATTTESVFERTDILWDWANAYALTGRPLPVMLPMDVTMVRTGETEGADNFLPHGVQRSWEEQMQAVDRYIRELQVGDEMPDAIGKVTVSHDGPLRAREWVTIEQTYTVGSMPMVPGGAVLLGRQYQANTGANQHEDPTGAHYVSIRSSNADAEFEPIKVPLMGQHGGFRSKRPMPAFRLKSATLQPGQTITVVYGDRSRGSKGLQMQTFATDNLILPLYLDLEGEGNFFTPEWPRLRVLGHEVASVSAMAPSIVRVGEPFELSIRSEDAVLNRATGPIPSYVVLLNGEPFREVAAGNQAITVLSDLEIDKPGAYRFTVRSKDERMKGTSNPVWALRQPKWRVFWGETHGHTEFAEGQGSAEEFFQFGKEDSRLDFLTLSEHDVFMDDFEWRTMQDLTRQYTEAGKFVAFLGYEWTAFRRRGGHHNVLFRTPDSDRVSVQDGHELRLLYEGLHRNNDPEDVLIIPHAHLPGDWTQQDAELRRIVEIYSMHGSFEWFGNMFLKRGCEVGFIGASDDHRSKPGHQLGQVSGALAGRGGLAAVLAPAKTADAIFSGLRSLAAYATNGPRILLDAQLNGSRMGLRQEDNPRRHIVCRASGTAPIDHMDVVKNGSVVFSRRYLAAPLTSRVWVQVAFESSSEVFGPERDNPRPYRTWEGSMQVSGARVQGLDVRFDNRIVDRAEIDPGNRNLVHFHAETRGHRDVMLVELDGASSGTTFHFRLKPTRERGSAPGLIRPAADLPADEFKLSFVDLKEGKLERPFQVDRHTDRIIIQTIDPSAPLDRDFEFTDLESTAPGDYYYVRVTQLDGGQAWSSPFWVGRK